MGINTWVVSGDTHGSFTHLFNELNWKEYEPTTTAVVLLGDSGTNFWRGRDRGSYKMDEKLQQELQASGFIWYVLRGNHDQRPETIPGTRIWYDNNVDNDVYVREGFPNIRYLIDGEIYTFDGYRCLALGGAYSVDKYLRLARQLPNGWCGWFENEQLNQQEKDSIYSDLCENKEQIDFVLTHTAPKSYEPTDLFLPQVDQSTVDSTMEEWLEEVKKVINWKFWLFGHYHHDRVEQPYVIQVYQRVWGFDEIDWLWDNYKKRGPSYFDKMGYMVNPNIKWCD